MVSQGNKEACRHLQYLSIWYCWGLTLHLTSPRILFLLICEEAGRLIGESAGNGSPLRTYIWRDEVPLAQIDHVPVRKTIYFDTDHLNTPRVARDQAGNVVWRWESDAFGSTAPNENPNGTGTTIVNLRFPGHSLLNFRKLNIFRSEYWTYLWSCGESF